MALLFDDLDRWFKGLWRGRALAVTVVWITAFVPGALPSRAQLAARLMYALRFFFLVLLLAAGGAFAQAYLW